jgi:uncharacterized protein YkwD
MPPGRSRTRRLPLLVALPVAGALAVSGALAAVGASSGQDGTIALAGSSVKSDSLADLDESAADPTTTTTSSSDTDVWVPRSKRHRAAWRSRPRWHPTTTTAAPTTQTTEPAELAETTTEASETSGSSDPSETSESSSSAPSTSTSTAPNTAYAAEVVRLTNEQRTSAGCKALTANTTLTAVAQAHSQDMADHTYFAHNSQDGTSPFQRMTAAGYPFSHAAENIAAGYPSPEAVVAGWMSSSEHKENILNCDLTEIGVGYATGSGDYPTYWTQDFGTPR